ncbi:alpha/beta hydrolase [Acidovorax sp. SUPP2522]|uniref:alpha/beta fold hydrolase n=1 Tax=unclassified Acidovorax TaxID=2684926 RepID=UPI00234AF181|nr:MULTISPECIES: alpha/beta hydrolase [unclassified Acidovorax]WCM97630.1 alpha/beta hydrolase [Acidovorax sp. GBBC 1281]GKT13204.1 alpha/beta hydrolase [Acidovorax sp. SUPP2522]
MTETRTLPSQGSLLSVQAMGQGLPVVLLHAAVCDRRMWAAQMGALAGTCRVMAYDRPGFGDSPLRTVDSSSMADGLAVLEGLGVTEPAVVVACSQGGRIALEMALAHPSRVRGLFLIAPSLSGAPAPAYPPEIESLLRGQQLAEQAQDWVALNRIKARLWLDGPLSPELRVGGDARKLFLAMNAIAIANRLRGGETDNVPVYGRLAEIRLPARVVWGDLDFPHVQQRAQMAADQMPNAQGIASHGVAHLPSLECPDAVTGWLRRFLGEI